jgi:hypothetical protein
MITSTSASGSFLEPNDTMGFETLDIPIPPPTPVPNFSNNLGVPGFVGGLLEVTTPNSTFQFVNNGGPGFAGRCELIITQLQ